MATKVIFVVTDDMDHSRDNVVTVRFALEGLEYEIDLAPHNLQRMRDAFGPYTEAGRRLPKHPAARQRNSGTRGGRSADAKVRDFWATHQRRLGLPPHRSRGPIPPKVREAYAAAH
ncbi:Lsr2 family protein [Plantactinospora sp. S1510]|uniref:Lsr2 family protein n=1 Tax=Plantactinospora alkalitolerans TaxID=2789879 RepID=A0ABS0H8B9_9ACTN|nr:Lsr2 family protein [Plantactinospora alkalitolerans]MBF9134718.1 Lsr2 family protein [Plantactinospora alkalitolerans]